VPSSSGGTLLRSGPVTVRDVHVLPADGRSESALFREDPFVIRVEFDLAEEVPGLDLTLFATTPTGVRVFDEALSDHGTVQLGAGSYRAELTVPPVLNFGDFTVGLWMGTMHRDLIHEPALTTFTLVGTGHDRPERTLVLNAPFEIRPASPASDRVGPMSGEASHD
jgi:ABC-2 type transport system ATP-binding protein/lipopolysaccharide transport system ATP-binding protein